MRTATNICSPAGMKPTCPTMGIGGIMNNVYFNGLDNPKDDKIIVEKVETTMVVDALRIATNKVLAQRNPKAKAYVYVDDELGYIEVCKTRFLKRIRYILH